LEVNDDLSRVTTREITMTNLDPQTTADFWDAYLRAAGAPNELGCPVGVPVSHAPRIASAAIRFAWDLVLMPAPTAA
jgi:hypothetical protein